MSTQNGRFFDKPFHDRVYARNLLRGIRLTYTSISKKFFLMTNPGFSFNKPTHYLLEYGDKAFKTD